MKKRLEEQLKTAMKAKDNTTLMTIRGVLSKITEQEKIDNSELSDDQILKVIQKISKQREDSITQFKSANRLDLVEKESKELEILKEYLPKQLDESEIRNILKSLIDSGNTNIGSIMKELNVYGTSLDKKVASSILKELL